MRNHGEHAAEPETATGELERRCSLCRSPVTAEFFTLHGQVVCAACANSVGERQERPENRRRATVYGLAAAVVGAATWFLATHTSGWPFSALAIPIGIVVGLAVRRGSGGRGGMRFQLTAVLLVYAAFALRMVPPVFGSIAHAIQKEHAAGLNIAADGHAPIAPDQLSDRSTATESSPSASTSAAPTFERTSILATLKAYFVFTLIAWGLILASPFMPDTNGLFGTFSLALGIAIAWRLNRRARLAGPFPPAG